MRGIITYLVAGILLMLAMDFVAPPVGLGFMAGAKPVALRPATIQLVDRTHKGDRLSLPAAGKQRTPLMPPAVMFGCDPVFSPLSASALANNVRSCVAEIAHPLAG
jgi:hypothetical protein